MAVRTEKINKGFKGIILKQVVQIQSVAGQLLRHGGNEMNYQNVTKSEYPVSMKVYDLLFGCGVTANYKGFFYAAHAIMLCVEDMQRLSLVTKRLYPEVAKQFNTTPECVERNIRTISDHIWLNNKEILIEISRKSITQKPTTSQFISIVTWYLVTDDGFRQ